MRQVCKRAKDSTQLPAGLLQPLPPPRRRFGGWSIDFMTNLPLCNGENAAMICIEGLLGYVHLIPCFMGDGELSAEHMAQLYFYSVVRVFGLPNEVLHDRVHCRLL